MNRRVNTLAITAIALISLVAAVAVTPTGASPASRASGSTKYGKCKLPPKRTRYFRTWARSSKAVVYTEAERSSPTVACLFKSGRSWDLDRPSLTILNAPVVVRGRQVAYWLERWRDEVEPVSPRNDIVVADVKTGRVLRIGLRRKNGVSGVSDIVLGSRNVVAWIYCDGLTDSDCRVGDPAWAQYGITSTVQYIAPDGREFQLDSGDDVEPRSLRLNGMTLSWRKAGKLRTYEIPA